MIIDTTINKFIDDCLMADNLERERTHEPSGKLSASMLFQPLRFQVLKTIGVPRKPIDAYVLGKFKRGNDVEDWYVSQIEKMGALLERQKPVEYRGAVGYIDAWVNSELFQFKQREMPHEVKSVTNAKLKRISKTGVDWHYKIQACFYALAQKRDYYAVDIVSAEDLRPNVYIFQTRELAQEVETIITDYQKAMEAWKAKQLLPAFIPNKNVMWTANLQYSMFEPQWATESDEWAIKTLQLLNLI